MIRAILIIILFVISLFYPLNYAQEEVIYKGDTCIIIYEVVPSHVRIKRKCGIPDSVEWSYKTKIMYAKQIEDYLNGTR